MPWVTCYNSKINWKTEEVKITRCSESSGDLSKENQDNKNKRRKRKERKE